MRPRRAVRVANCAACELDLLARVVGAVSEVHRRAGRYILVEPVLPQLRRDAVGELAEIGHMMFAAGLTRDRAVESGRDIGRFDALEQRGHARQRDGELRDVADATERVDRGVEERECFLGIGIDQLEQRGIARDESFEEVHPVLAHVAEPLAPRRRARGRDPPRVRAARTSKARTR